MTKKGLRPVFAVALALMTAAVFCAVAAVSAEETKLVRIYGGDTYNIKELRLEPQTLLIQKGGVVIWNNWARSAEVKVKFEDGKVCELGTDSPVGFALDKSVCYITNLIPLGGTASLQFVKEGKYDYTVQTPGGIKVQGRVEVYK